GAGNSTYYILREFSKIPDLELDLITSSTGEYREERIGENIMIYYLPIGKRESNLHFQSKKDLIVYAWKALIFSQKLAERKKYDLTHSFFSVPCGAISWYLSKKKKIPYIVSLRGSDVPGYSERFGITYKILTPFIKAIWKKAFSVIANSASFRDMASKIDPARKIKVITNGVAVDEFRAIPIEKKKKDSDRFEILCGTRITPRKGFEYLVMASKKLKDKNHKISLKIIGEGYQKEELESLIKKLGMEKDVEFTGVLDRKEITKCFSLSRIFVSTSLNEGMSNAMLEALASGLPIIATNTGGTAEIVRDGKNGFVINMKDACDTAEKIERIILDEELEKRMALESRRIAESMSWQKVAENYFNEYENCRRKRNA
ncbi:MAG: glycosyltransferase family 4 protein, partial [Candidatus Moranbacteria bacterium]|nr:glycosyltransferase family 4 protein [Candidatus Moranbacteria bacterium]